MVDASEMAHDFLYDNVCFLGCLLVIDATLVD